MKILNIIWAFSTGGIGKCFLTYNRVGEVNKDIQIKSVCIDILNRDYDRKPLKENDIQLISIKSSFDISWLKRLATLIKEEQPDRIFCHGFNGPVVVMLLKIRFGFKMPMICSYHGLYHAPTKLKKLIAPIYNWVQVLIYKRWANRVILVEKYSLNNLKKRGVKENKLMVVYNGIIEEVNIDSGFILPYKKNQISLLVASRLDAVKGIEYLIRALPLVKENSKVPFILYIVGDGPEQDKIKSLIQENNLGNEVHLMGYQNNIDSWLKAVDVFLLPSLFEYHSIALLEAMRASKAIVATTVGGNPESIRDGKEGILVPDKDPIALSKAIIRFMESAGLRNEFGENARKRYQELFTEDIMMNNLAKALIN